MHYDFDTEISRAETKAAKWTVNVDETGFHLTDQYFGDNRVLPMWVADMDFRTAQPIIDALTERAQHGLYGYTWADDAYYASVVNWLQRRHGWQIDPSWIVTAPGVVPALIILVRALLNAGEKAIIQPPVYGPFKSAIEGAGGVVAANPLIYENGRYTMDFADLEAKASDPQTKIAILCHPHNPVGRVWDRDELTRFAEICIANDVLMISDEIHGDLTLPDHKFIPLASLKPEYVPQVITLTSATKTFNLGGLHLSSTIIADADKRQRFEQGLMNMGLLGVGAMSVTAAEAAYTEGDEWLDQLRAYIDGNVRYLVDYFAANLPQIRVVPPEGTYLAWLDCRALELDQAALHHLMLDDARVRLEDGTHFGSEGEGFLRINLACPRSILVEALDRIKDAVFQLNNK